VNAVRIRLGPLWPYAVLIGLPAAAFILPDLIGGRLVMTGDNLQQNYPLHVLVGSMVRHGQLPFWNPYLFSGTPLLADFNAGAFYPLVGLFVILPDRVAWIATEVILFSLIGVGMYLFLRALTLSTVACVLAALTFVCSGVVVGQANHVDMTEGFASIPFMLLAVLHIVRDGRWRWSVLLGVGFALVIFGGAPEAMLDEALLVAVYAAVSAGFDRVRWWRVLTRCGTGAVVALGLAAAQWLPGLTAIANSQRSGLGTSFTGSGSFPPAYSLLSLVPYLYGGFGHLGEAMFFSHYNLPEVEIYMGILPVIALLTLWRPQWPSRLAARERRTWYVVGLIGLLLAFGANTLLEHLFNAIPLYGRQRLQSRNMIDVVVATCVLFAGWIDRRGSVRDRSVTFDRRIALIPFSFVLALAGWALVAPAALVTTLSSGSGSPAEAHTVREATLIALGFCAAAATIVWLRPVLRRRRWLLLVSAFTVLDLGVVAGTSGLVTLPSNALVGGTTPIESHVAADLTSGGRFDVFDPQRYGEGPSEAAAGLPDDNVLARLPSVGGYASIVNGDYDARTLTHEQGQLNIALLGAGDLDGLDLQAIVTAPEYFLLPLQGTPTSLGAVRRVAETRGTDPVLPMGIQADVVDGGYPAYPSPRGALATGRSSTWFFGASLQPQKASVLVTTPSAADVRIRFGTVHANGSMTWGAPVTVPRGALSVAAPLPSGTAAPAGSVAPTPAVGLAVQVISGRLPPHQATITVGTRTYELDGSLSDVVRPGPWRTSGSTGGYSLFQRTTAPHPLYAIGRAGSPSPHVSVVSAAANSETARVRAAASTVVVRDVAWDAGWHASVTVNGGPAELVRISPHGLTQEVRLPAGTDLITFTYRPPHWLVASTLSEGSFLFLVVLAAVVLYRRGRRRQDQDGGDPRNEDGHTPLVRPGPPTASPPAPVAPTAPARDPYVVSSMGGPTRGGIPPPRLPTWRPPRSRRRSTLPRRAPG
jgi:hypothetical protein